jgi:mRNA-degrading endonuclease toxin of MazEF toxin-antitoxin module
MPLDVAELRRGHVCYAIYPFAAQMPFRLGDNTMIPDVETFARTFGGQPAAGLVEVRLRPILLLHDGTRGEHDDVACLRINTVKPRHRNGTETWRRITEHEHPFFFHLPPTANYGLRAESVIAITSVGTIHKSAILRHVGGLNRHEMQIVNERLGRALSLDLAARIAAQARELFRRAGFELP